MERSNERISRLRRKAATEARRMFVERKKKRLQRVEGVRRLVVHESWDSEIQFFRWSACLPYLEDTTLDVDTLTRMEVEEIPY